MKEKEEKIQKASMHIRRFQIIGYNKLFKFVIFKLLNHAMSLDSMRPGK